MKGAKSLTNLCKYWILVSLLQSIHTVLRRLALE